MLAILVLLPLVTAAFLSLALRRTPNSARYAALAASMISLLLIIMLFYQNQNQLQSTTWFTLSGYPFALSTSTAPLNMILLLIVGAVTPLIVVYSIGFMSLPSEQARYYFELCAFASAMMLFAISADFITMLIGWELLGITSYLLIGFWYKKEGTATAARKAITTIIIGDILMLIAMLVIWNTYHTFSFSFILQQAGGQNLAIGFALTLIIIAAATKSAQFPFHEWLPDAMKGPTPVSAFLHSSTMVKAGVFLVALLLPLFAAYHLLYILLIMGLITAILGATNALTELHIKRILAYSTIEDLGLMFVALGTGSLLAAMMLFIVQTFYKALLFMSAGSIIKANNNEEEMERLYNTPLYPKLFIPTVIGVVSLAGLFPLSGFFGKAAVEAAATNNIIVYSVLIAVAFLSNIYIFRWLLVPLHARPQRKRLGPYINYKTLPQSMLIPIYILAALVITGALSYASLPGYLSQYNPLQFSIRGFDIYLSSAIIVLCFIISYYIFYHKGYSIMDERSELYKLFYNSKITNSVYLHITDIFSRASEIIDRFDYSFYSIIKDGAQGVGSFADIARKLENGSINTYLAAFVIGLAVILIIFIL